MARSLCTSARSEQKAGVYSPKLAQPLIVVLVAYVEPTSWQALEQRHS